MPARQDTEGLSFGKPERKMGWNAQPTTTVMMDNVRVPVDSRVGQVGVCDTSVMNEHDGRGVRFPSKISPACLPAGLRTCPSEPKLNRPQTLAVSVAGGRGLQNRHVGAGWRAHQHRRVQVRQGTQPCISHIGPHLLLAPSCVRLTTLALTLRCRPLPQRWRRPVLPGHRPAVCAAAAAAWQPH